MMTTMYLCVVLGVAAVLASSSSSSSSKTTTDTTSSSDESSGYLRAALVDRAKNPTIKLGFLESDHHDDDDDSLSGSEDDYYRRKERDERRIAQAIAHAAITPPTPRESYQAKFSRDNDRLCVFDENFPRNGTSCTQRNNGPVFFIAKTSSSPVTADSFDGNKDGKDDVKAAFDALRNGAGGGGFETLINAFLQQVRNRATINGGSIDLSALILTGRRPNGQFATFGPSNTVLFSPCFPVIQNPLYNMEMWGISQGLNTLFQPDVALNYNLFVDPGPEPLKLNDDVFLDRVPEIGTIKLTALDFVNPDPKKVDANGARLIVSGLEVGEVIFEKCTQYSYFQ